MSEGETVERTPSASGWSDRPAKRVAIEGYRYSRRYVLVPEADVLKTGRNGKVFGYNVRTLAKLVGMSTSNVSKDIAKGLVNPWDLASILRWVIQRVKPPAEVDIETAPPLWRHFDKFSLIAGPTRGPMGANQIYLAVQMPSHPASEEMVRLFWAQRGKLASFRGSSYELAWRMFELDGISPESLLPHADRSGRMQPHSRIRMAARVLRRLVTAGVLVHDEAAKSWAMAPFPATLEEVTDALRVEGFGEAEIRGHHIGIGRDLFALSAARRLLAYMRTNRLKSTTCGRDKRLWIVNGMERAFHGYKERRIFRRSGEPAPEDPAPRA